MAATHIVPASHAAIDHAPEAPIARPRVVMVGTALAIAGTLLFFAGLLGIYLHERANLLATGGTWIPEKSVIPLQQPNVMLFALIASAVTMQWAVDAIRRDDRQQAYLALGVTLLFGAAVLNMAAYLYSIMNLDISIQSPAPVLIYVITGAHLLMLLGAMVFTALMSFRALGGQFTSRQHDGVSAAAMFWHAQVIVFAFVWYAIYIVK
jgi:heme/copper-type cytochrome/quinol oxidase subunit 3